VTVDAVIFDWGGTLTPWLNFDGRGWWRIAAKLVPAADVERVGAVLHEAEEAIWRRSRDEHRSGTLAEVFAAAGLPADAAAYAAHDEEWEPATYLDPDAVPVLEGLRLRGIRIGVLSNTAWTRDRHQQIFVRDRVDHFIDGAVYTSEIPWTKPHPEAFRAAMVAVGADDPARCVFVGDRPFDDIYGARQVGMRAVLVPHSTIPTVQHGHTQGEPDAVIQRLTELLDHVDRWHLSPASA
jgi:putative hydrolase of the HAD superfamily